MDIDKKKNLLTLSMTFEKVAQEMLGKDIFKAYASREKNQRLSSKVVRGMLGKMLWNRPKFTFALIAGAKETAKKHADEAEDYLAEQMFVPYQAYAESLMRDIYPNIDKEKFCAEAKKLILAEEKKEGHNAISTNMEEWIGLLNIRGDTMLTTIALDLKRSFEGASDKKPAPQNKAPSTPQKPNKNHVILK
jgi:hypothetical protein